jgi:hypothetical protein
VENIPQPMNFAEVNYEKDNLSEQSYDEEESKVNKIREIERLK